MNFDDVSKHLNAPVRVVLTQGPLLSGVLERAHPPVPGFSIRGVEFTADAVRELSVLDESMLLPEVDALVGMPVAERLRTRDALVTRMVSELGRAQQQAEVWLESELVRRKAPSLAKECGDKLFSFVGYGVDNPKFIFLGAEEALTGSALVNLTARCQSFRFPLHDKDQALDQLADAYEEHGAPDDAAEYRAAHAPGHVPTWKFCAMLAAALRSASGDWRSRWEEEYRKLGRRTADSDTLLAELYPLPKPGLDKWPPTYTALFGVTTAARYFSQVWPRRRRPNEKAGRRERIQAAIRKNSPTHIIQYSRGTGGEFWDRFDGIVDLVESRRPTGEQGRWHVVSPSRIEVALAQGGVKVARLGFPWGRAAETSVTDSDVPVIVNALQHLSVA